MRNFDSSGSMNVQVPKPTEPGRAPQGRLTCAVEATLDVIGGRWKVLILRELMHGVQRFNQLHRALQGITQKMLTQQLRELEEDGIIHREVYLQVPPKVEYSLTETGQTLKPVLEAMHDWGATYISRQAEESGGDGS
jgi:DNA-binding HxlR family transcriptional regulator